MSILSTNKKLISIGAEYSAGQGIDISGHIISVVESAVGANYSAGPNIDIYDVEGQPTISSKDWSSDIADASANAYEQAIAQIPAPQDLSYISAKVDTNTSGINYISSVCLTAHQDWTDTIKGASSYSYEQSTSYFDNWVNGQYTGDVTNITNKISALSGDFSDYYKKTETSSKDEINDALQYVSANAGKVYEGVSPIVVNNDENKVSADTWTFSAGSNVSFVDDNVNKITRIDVELPTPQDLSYISAQVDSANAGVDYLSGVVITALPSDLATTGDVNDLAQSVSETYQTKGDYAERAFVLSSIESATSGKLDVSSFSSVSSDFLTNDDLNGYATEQWVENKGYLTAVDLSDYAKNSALSSTSSFLSGAIQYVSANAAADQNVNQAVYTNSSTWNEVTNKLDESAFQDVSGLFLTAIPQEYVVESDIPGFISAKLDTTAFSTVSGDFLTAHQDISYKLDTTAFEDVSGTFATNEALENTSGAITSLIPTDYYPDTNPSGFISGVDLTPYATNEDLQIVSGGVDYVSGELTAYALASQLPTNDQLLPYPMTFVATSGEATGTNILYVVTGTGE